MAFVDLVQAFDTVNHVMMLKLLERYNAPPKLRSSIARMYQDLKVVLKIGKIEEKMSQTVGVIQGDCMAPFLFLFMVMVFAETLETEWIKGISKNDKLATTHTLTSRRWKTNRT